LTVCFRIHIRPLCDKHHMPMMKTTLLTPEGTREVYRCTEAACTRHYDVSNGYFDLVDKAVFFDGFQRCCTSDGSAMYFSGRNPQTDTDTWRCPRVGCEPEQLTTDDEERHALPSHELLSAANAQRER